MTSLEALFHTQVPSSNQYWAVIKKTGTDPWRLSGWFLRSITPVLRRIKRQRAFMDFLFMTSVTLVA
jgi:hypothetical protein